MAQQAQQSLEWGNHTRSSLARVISRYLQVWSASPTGQTQRENPESKTQRARTAAQEHPKSPLRCGAQATVSRAQAS